MQDIGLGMATMFLAALVCSVLTRETYRVFDVDMRRPFNLMLFFAAMVEIADGRAWNIQMVVALGFLFNLQSLLIDLFMEYFGLVRTHREKRKNKPAEVIAPPIQIPVEY